MATKSFKDQLTETTKNPIAPFISKAKPAPEDPAPVKEEGFGGIPAGYKLDRRYVETRNKRIQVLLQPSTHAKLKARADAEGISVNELINNLLISALG